MEEIYKSGRAKAIGVSKFRVKDVQAILDSDTITPAVNQIRLFIGFTQNEVTKFCQDKGILVDTYSPLATGQILNNPQVKKLVDKYNKIVAQICIRYTLQRDTVTLQKSTHEEYILQNVDVDFVIDEQDMQYLNQLQDIVEE